MVKVSVREDALLELILTKAELVKDVKVRWPCCSDIRILEK